MKLKIRGLVFVGFAAAVFASSAMADDPNPIVPPSLQSPTPHPDALKKTVVSQDYTDETFQERASTANGYALAEDKDGNVTDKAALIGWAYGQNSENKEWVKLEGKKQLNSASSGDNNFEYVEIVHEGSGNSSKHYVQLNDTALTMTTGEGASLSTGAQKITAAGGQNATTLEQNRLTTAKAVYDFVTDGANSGTGLYQPKVDATNDPGDANIIRVGWYNQGANNGAGAATWSELRATANGSGDSGSLAYLTIDRDTQRNAYNVNIKSAAIADQANNITAAGVSGAYSQTTDKLTTAKAVYDYAQPRLGTVSAAHSVNVGYKSAADADSTWTTLGVDSTAAGSSAANYVSMNKDGNGVYTINLAADQVVTASTDIGANTGTMTANNGNKLPTVSAVHGYAVRQDWGSENGGKMLVTNPTTGVVELSTVPALPGIVNESDCRTEGKHCALVTNANSNGDVTFEWVVMAGN